MENMMVCGSQMKGQEFDAKMPEALAIGAEMDVSLYNQLAEMVGGTKMMVKRKGHKIIIKPVAPEQVSKPKKDTRAEEKAEWVDKVYHEFEKEWENGWAAVNVNHKLATVTVIADGSLGVAHCHPNDEFNEDIGIAVAYAKASGIKIPDCI